MPEVQGTSKFRYAPLSTSFFIVSIFGFLIATIYLPKVSMTWAFTLGIIFLLMLIAAFITMIKGSPEPQLP